jgi:hypothetical protein
VERGDRVEEGTAWKEGNEGKRGKTREGKEEGKTLDFIF